MLINIKYDIIPPNIGEKNQLQKILIIIIHFILLKPRFKMLKPNIAPIKVCVVETGKPKN